MKSQEQANRPGNTRLVCTFCGKGEPLVNKIIAGPGVYICDQCVDLCNEILDGTKATEHSSKLNLAPGQSADLIKCSFCGKKQNQVVTGQIIIGPAGNICAECTDLCNQILDDELFEGKESTQNNANPTDQLSMEETKQLRLKLKQRIGREYSKLRLPQIAGEQQILDALNTIMAQLTAIQERLDKLEARKPD